MPRVICIISGVQKSLAFEWIEEKVNTNGVCISYILLNSSESELEAALSSKSDVTRLSIDGVFKKVRAFTCILSFLVQKKPDAIHCHLRWANIIGITAGWLAGTKKRIYTRHFSTLNHNDHPRAVIVDKLINRLSTHIVAISDNVSGVLREKEYVPKEKVVTINHGFDLKSFMNTQTSKTTEVANKWNIDLDYRYIGVISRLVYWKGLQYIIPAFIEFQKRHPNFRLILANAHGPYESDVMDLLSSLPTHSYTIVPFESDIQSLYSIFDIYVHCPIDPQIEAFGQTYVEALASGVPSIFTLSGVAREFINDRENALVVPFKNSQAIADALQTLVTDESLREKLIFSGKKSVHRFNIDDYTNRLRKLYIG